MTPAAEGMTALTAPVVVRVLDLEAPLVDLDLSHQCTQQDYRSVLTVVRLAEGPIGMATFPLDAGGRVTRAQLLGGLHRQLSDELEEAYARRDRASNGSAVADGAIRGPVPSVSVVIPTCDNPGPLQRCLRSILDCDYEDFELIVVENRPGSADTARILRQLGGERTVRYVEEPRPSASLARNAGLARAEGEIVAFTDDDVVVDPLWLRASVEQLLRADSIACVTGLILPLELENENQLLLEQFAGFGKGFAPKTYRLPESRAENPLLPYAAGALGSGASIVMRTEVARELGGFDPALGPATPAKGGEDIDLLVRLLRSGHALSYEPRAIVWHEHPGGPPRRLRRQVYHYGVGLGAMLGKQLIAGPRRRDLLGAVPAGLRHLRDPKSRKNVGKPAGYPRHLTWLERLGMLVGPLAYLVSALIVRARRTALAQLPTPRPLRIVRQMAVGGETVSLVWFREDDGPPVGAEPRPTGGRPGPSPWLMLGVALTCLVAPLLVLFGAPTPVRVPFILALMCLAPGTAWLTATGRRAEPGLVIGISTGLAGVIAQSMLWLGAWWPGPFLYGLAAVCLLPLTRGLWTSGFSLTGGLSLRAWCNRGRLTGLTTTSATAIHTALIAGALLIWAASLTGADLSRIDGLGLLPAMPATYFLAFALLLGGFVAAVTRRELNPRLLGAYVVALIVVLYATTAVLYDVPRYAWTYPHLGLINLIAGTGRADRQIDIYNNWPSFFALCAWFTRTSRLDPIAYAGWAQVFFNLFNVCALRFALRGVTRDERILWTATLLFVIGNWVGQDYLAPQAYAYALSLVILGLCLRCGPQVMRPHRGWRWLSGSILGRIARAVLSRQPAEHEAGTPPIGGLSAVLAGGACYLAVVTSHQLSPVILTVSVFLLALVTRRVPLWVPVAMAALELWWVLLAWSFLTAHFNLIDPGGAGAAAPGRNLAVAPGGAALGFYAPGAVMLLVGGIAFVGMVRRLIHGKWDVVAMCLIAGPLGVVAVQSYGGEGVYRGYLFSLPWFSFLAALACTARRSRPGAARISRPRLLAVLSVVGVCLLFAVFGQEMANHVTSNDVRASVWYEEHAPPGSMRIDLAPNAPDRLTARYPLVSLSDPPPLVDRLGFTGHRLGSGDVPRLIALIRQQRARPAYVVLSRLQEDYARLNGLLPSGSLSSFVAALRQSPSFHLVYRLSTVWIFKYAGPNASEPLS